MKSLSLMLTTFDGMRNSFRHLVSILKAGANRFDTKSIEAKHQYLMILSKTALLHNLDLISYFEALLFLIAYPADEKQLALAEKELLRITVFLKKYRNKVSKLPDHSGMPFTKTTTRFSHDGVRWLLSHPHCTTELHSFEYPLLSLNEVLGLTLPSLERSVTTMGLNNLELLDALKVSKTRRLSFLVNELARLDHLPLIKDLLFDRLEVFVRITPKDKSFSKAYNRLPRSTTFFTQTLIKKFDAHPILNEPLTSQATLSKQELQAVILVVKNSMAITARETDPTTFMEESSFRLYHLERGISIAIYGMIPSRQLALESYVGFTAFKNGFPVAYGGAWVFGERASFGLNVFETFRGGESGYIMTQLLRVYKNVFSVHYFEIEPNQFGLDNPEGIASGAFWFYYRHGFRPLDRHLRQKAEKEFDKMQSRKGYRTSEKTLILFTESSMVFQSDNYTPLRVSEIFSAVTRMIQQLYEGNRSSAEKNV